MTSVDRPWIWAQSGWMSRPIPAIIFTIPSGISRLPWVSSPWLWNFTPPFPRHGRATNTRGGGWRRGSRRARTVASGARRRRLWSLRATTNGHELAGADLPEAALALTGNPDPCLGGRRSWADRAGSVGLRLDPFCLIEFWASSQAFRKARSPYGLIGAQLAHMRTGAAAIRCRRLKRGTARSVFWSVSAGGTTTFPSSSGCMFAPKILEMRCYRVWVTYRPGPLRRTGPGFSAKGKQWAQRKRGGSPPLPERSA